MERDKAQAARRSETFPEKGRKRRLLRGHVDENGQEPLMQRPEDDRQLPTRNPVHSGVEGGGVTR